MNSFVSSVNATLSIVLFFVSACTSIKVRENRDANYSKRITCILIKPTLAKELEDLASGFAEAFDEYLKKHKTRIISSASECTSETDTLAILAIEQSHAYGVKDVSLVLPIVTSSNLLLRFTLEDNKLQKPIWKAVVELQRKNYGLPGKSDGRKLAQIIYGKLKRGSLLD